MGQDSAGGAVEGLLDVLPGGPHLVDGVGDGVELQQGDLGLCRLLHELCPAEPVDGTGAHATKVFAVGGCTSSSMGTSGIGPEWVTLPSSRGRFSGQLDATAIDPGAQRMHMRVQPENDSGNRLLTVPYLRQETGIAWEAQVEGMVQGALATVGDGGEELLVIGDSFGKVTALDHAGVVRWTAAVGGGEIRHDLVPHEEGASVVAPDTAGFLHRFGADGSARWSRATGVECVPIRGAGW